MQDIYLFTCNVLYRTQSAEMLTKAGCGFSFSLQLSPNSELKFCKTRNVLLKILDPPLIVFMIHKLIHMGNKCVVKPGKWTIRNSGSKTEIENLTETGQNIK